MWFRPRVGVDMVLEGGEGFEPALAHRALVGPLIAVALQVTTEKHYKITFNSILLAIIQ